MLQLIHINSTAFIMHRHEHVATIFARLDTFWAFEKISKIFSQHQYLATFSWHFHRTRMRRLHEYERVRSCEHDQVIYAIHGSILHSRDGWIQRASRIFNSNFHLTRSPAPLDSTPFVCNMKCVSCECVLIKPIKMGNTHMNENERTSSFRLMPATSDRYGQ